MLSVRPSILEDIDTVAQDMRLEDIAEVDAAGGGTPYEGLKHGFDDSDECFTIVKNNNLAVGMFGYKVTYPGICGVVWMLATNQLARHKYSFVRQTGQWLEHMHHHAPLLYNLVDARNLMHIKWLEWSGFNFVRRHDLFGPKNLPFIEFVRLRHV